MTLLEMLHQAAGLRDFVVEGRRAFQQDVSDRVLGLNDAPSDVWYRGRTEFLNAVRALNETRPDDEKIRVHRVDVYGQLSTSHAFLLGWREKMGPATDHLQIPPSHRFETWRRAQRLALVDQLSDVARDDDSLFNELETQRSTTRFRLVGERISVTAPHRPRSRMLHPMDVWGSSILRPLQMDPPDSVPAVPGRLPSLMTMPQRARFATVSCSSEKRPLCTGQKVTVGSKHHPEASIRQITLLNACEERSRQSMEWRTSFPRRPSPPR